MIEKPQPPGARHPSEAGELWRPTLFSAADDTARRGVDAIASRAGVQVFDTLAEQAAELVETRHPSTTLSPVDIERLVEQSFAPFPASHYGIWAFYPWSQRLCRVLPADEFTELRLSRNRNKITAMEQARLLSLRIGIAGLSVGQATAITLAMEGVGGEFLLADFDRLSLSNMNRLRAGVHEIGVAKTVLTARGIFEINPFANVQLFPDGLNDDNVDVFLDDGRRLDLLVEECDDLYIKMRLRERARAHRIPVLMETSDRGMVDVERFDLEPDRPLFHGLIGDLQPDALRGLDTYHKVPVVMRILGADTLSPRLAASMVDVGDTLKTWPQLASAVSLGAALNVDTARRIALGQHSASGRFYADLEHIMSPAPRELVAPVPAPAILEPPPISRPPVTDALIAALVECGCAAPSGGNCQPWRFEYDGTRLRGILDAARSRSLMDFDQHASYLAFGAAIENIALAAEARGHHTEVDLFPEPGNLKLVCTLSFPRSRREGTPDPLHSYIMERCTNRRLGPPAPLPAGCAARLRNAAQQRGAALQIVTDRDRMTAVGEILGRGDRLRFVCRTLHDELMRELRWSEDEARRAGDGIDIRTLELTATDLAGLRLTSSWQVMELVSAEGGGGNLEKMARKAVAGSSALGRLTIPGSQPEHFVQGGRALQRVWLEATALKLGFQPMTPPFFFMRPESAGEGLHASDRNTLQTLQACHLNLLPLEAGHSELLLFRLSLADSPSARSRRRPIEDMLSFGIG